MKYILSIITFFLVGNLISQNKYEIGLRHYENDSNEIAMKFFNDLLNSDSLCSKCYMMIGATYLQMNNYPLAKENIEYSIKLDSNHMSYYYLGKYYVFKESYDSAIISYNTSIQLNKFNAKAYYDRSICYLQQGKLYNSLNDINIAIGMNNKNEDFFNLKGYLQLNNKDYELAIIEFTKSINIKPTQKAYANKGLAYFKLENFNEAITNFSLSLLLFENDPEIYYFRAKAYLYNDNKELACLDFKKSHLLGNIKSKLFYESLCEK